MPIGLLTGLGAAIAWGTMDVLAALGGRRLGSLVVVVATQSISLVVVLILVPIMGADLTAVPAPTVLRVLLLGAIAMVAYLAYFTGLRIGPIAVVSPTVAAYGGLTVVLAVIVLGESLTPIQAAGAAVATIGIVMTGVALDGGLRGIRLTSPGIAFAVVAMVLFAILTVFLAGPIRAEGWLPILVVERVGNVAAAVILLVVVRATRTSRASALTTVDEPDRSWRTALVVLAAALLDIAGLISFGIGLEVADAWIVGLVSSFNPAFSVLIAVSLLGERLKPMQWAGLGLLAAGLVVIAVSR